VPDIVVRPDGTRSEDAQGPRQGADPAEADPWRRVLELERRVRMVEDLLAVRTESFRALMERLVEAERLVHRQECALRAAHAERGLLIRQKDEAQALATALQELRIYRYTRPLRWIWGAVLRLVR